MSRLLLIALFDAGWIHARQPGAIRTRQMEPMGSLISGTRDREFGRIEN